MDKTCRVYEMGCKEVINLSDGARLGFVRDVEIDVDTGQVKALVIPGKLRFLGLLGRESDIMLPWASIERLGEDIIFVRQEGLPSLPGTGGRRSAGIF